MNGWFVNQTNFRLKLEYDELMAVKSELEQRKRSEFKEMEDLREEIATMQTLYQYRYSLALKL